MEKSEVAASRPEESPTIINDNIIPDFFHNDLAPRASPIESKHFLWPGKYQQSFFFQQYGTVPVLKIVYFFASLECVGHFFAYVAHFVIIWIRKQKAAVASRRYQFSPSKPCLFVF